MAQRAEPAPGLRFDRVEKRYGSVFALKKLILEVASGECLALAGRNGSGKTTLLRVAAGLVRPTTGKWEFVLPTGEVPRIRPGYVAHATMAYDELSAEENLTLFAKLLQIPSAASRVSALLEEVGLRERRNSLVRTFSRGMRQRLAIARALLHDPGLLLFDEPGTGLDPEGTTWLAAKLRTLRDSGCTILMSVHGESEISTLATRAVRLEAGSVAADTRSGGSFRSVLGFLET